jgi:hypothetical protein
MGMKKISDGQKSDDEPQKRDPLASFGPKKTPNRLVSSSDMMNDPLSELQEAFNGKIMPASI